MEEKIVTEQPVATDAEVFGSQVLKWSIQRRVFHKNGQKKSKPDLHEIAQSDRSRRAQKYIKHSKGLIASKKKLLFRKIAEI